MVNLLAWDQNFFNATTTLGVALALLALSGVVTIKLEWSKWVLFWFGIIYLIIAIIAYFK